MGHWELRLVDNLEKGSHDEVQARRILHGWVERDGHFAWAENKQAVCVSEVAKNNIVVPVVVVHFRKGLQNLVEDVASDSFDSVHSGEPQPANTRSWRSGSLA